MQYARSKVYYAIGEFIYMLPIDMNLWIGKIKNYSSKILVSSSSFNIGTNLKINLDDDKHIEKDKLDVKPNKPEIKSKKEDKQDMKIIKTRYLYSMVDVEMIYFLLGFVIKYVYIKFQHLL